MIYKQNIDTNSFMRYYLTGAVHYLLCNGEYVGFDRSQNVVADVINRYFKRNEKAIAI